MNLSLANSLVKTLKYFNVSLRSFSLTSTVGIDDNNFDNQYFYKNIRYGYKQGRRNIRNLYGTRKTRANNSIQKLTRVRVVDNSALGTQAYHRYPRIIHCYSMYKHGGGKAGQMVLITIGGEKKKAFVVGQRQIMGHKMAKQDTNNVILLENDGNPTGTRITVPIPAWLRGHKPTRYNIQMSKIIAIAGRFV